MWSPILLLAALVASAAAHGRVFQPPSRSSAWRFGFPTPADYDDDGANCGGFAVQHSSNGGKCGICGDAYNLETPRPHELGGTYGLGLIVANYQPGSSITTLVDLTTSHKGFWQFKLCPDPQSNDQACFDKYVLTTEDGETTFYPNKGSAKYTVAYKLPSGLTCEHCVLQWRYTAGNNWGICANGTSGLGCGQQEQFGACSDISIGTSKTKDGIQSDDIPSALMYYLKNGYFNAQQGILHLLRGVPPKSVQKRPVQQNQPQGQQSQSQGHKPQLQKQQCQAQAQQSFQGHNNQRPTQTSGRPLHRTKKKHPNQISSLNPRPSQNGQRNQRIVLYPKSEHNDQQSQSEQNDKQNEVHYNTQLLNQIHQQIHSHLTGKHNQHKQVVQQNSSLGHTQLNHPTVLNQPQKSIKFPHNHHGPIHTHSVQITTHTVHTSKHPLTKHRLGPQGKPWKAGKSARFRKSKKRKRKGKLKRRKKMTDIDEYNNRIIKVGTW